MPTEKQKKAIEEMLKIIDSIDYDTVNDYYSDLDKLGYSYDYVNQIKLLSFDLNLIGRINNSNYEIKPTENGYNVLKIGVDRYFNELEGNETLDKDVKSSTINGVKLSKVAIIISIISLILYFIYSIFDLVTR